MMFALLMAFLSSGAMKYVKYGLIAVAIAGAFFYIKNMGVQSERARWEKAALVEQGRQEQINNDMQRIGKEMADKLAFGTSDMAQQLEGAENEARNETGTDVVCLSVPGVLRLNSIR